MKLGYHAPRRRAAGQGRHRRARSEDLEKASAQGCGRREPRPPAGAAALGGRPAEGSASSVLEPYEESEDPETLNALGHRADRRGAAGGRAAGIRAGARDRPGRTRDAYQNTGIALLKLDRARGGAPEPGGGAHVRQAARAGLERARRGVDCAWADPTKAIAAWEQCVELNPEQYDALYNIGRVAGPAAATGRRPAPRWSTSSRRRRPAQYGKDIAEVRGVLWPT